MSNKPQTTRTSIRTVLTTDDYQMVFVDTPGMHTPKNKLGQFMMKEVYNSIEDVDVIIYMVEATDKKIGKGDSRIIEELRKAGAPVILVINKIDLVEKESLLPLIAQYAQAYEFEEIIPVSALNADTKNQVLDVLFKLLPEGELYYPEDMLTDQQSKVLAQELIREKLLQLLSEEVPHGIGIEIISFKEDNDNNVIYIDADIYCEKKSHKGIVIGKNGTMLKRVGTLARQDMENLFDAKVVLKLWVKVKDDWRNNDFVLNELGYKDKD